MTNFGVLTSATTTRCNEVMKKVILAFLVFSFCNAFAQEDAWVYFADKPDTETFFANPLSFFTERALNRRAQQNIALDSKDVPISESYVATVENSSGIVVLAKSRWFNAVHVRGSVDDINALQNLTFVSEIDFANSNLNASGRFQQNLVNKHNAEALTDFSYGFANAQIQQINGQVVHQSDFTGTGKIIAVLDSGFPGVFTAAPFERLVNNNRILGTYNYVTRETNVANNSSHGTAVLSTMGGFIENQYAGTAPDAEYYLFVTEDVASENPVEESLWVEAAEEADRLGVDVINTSLGYFQYDNASYSYTYADMNGQTAFISRGADIAFSRGMIVVVSAGNSGGTSTPNISAPADAQHAFTIGAVDNQGNLASFSSVGPTADNRIKPDVVARGVTAAVIGPTGSVSGANGTSFSAPIVSGMIASLWQALPNFTNQQIMDLIRNTASSATNPQNTIGYGIPNFGNALQTGLTTADLNKSNVQVFPNPFSNQISLIQIEGSAQLEVCTIEGKRIFQATVTENVTLDTASWSKGIYLFAIHQNGKSTVKKLIKN